MADSTMTSADEALAVAAENEIRNYSGVRVWADALALNVRNGVVELGGHVRTRAEREVTENVVLKTKGVKDVISHVYVDTDLEIAVGKALGDDARTRGGFPGILIGSAFGDIYLKGSVSSADMKKAAAEIAEKVDGTRLVINALEVAGGAKPAAAAGAAKPVVAPKPVVAGAKPVVAVKPPVAGAVKPAVAGAVKPPASASGKPVVVARKPAGAGSGDYTGQAANIRFGQTRGCGARWNACACQARRDACTYRRSAQCGRSSASTDRRDCRRTCGGANTGRNCRGQQRRSGSEQH